MHGKNAAPASLLVVKNIIKNKCLHAISLLTSSSRWLSLALLLAIVGVQTSCRVDSDSTEKGKNMSTNAKTQAKTRQGEPPPASYAETVDKDGKKVWVLTLGKSKYRIPEAYLATLDNSGAWLHLHWPSALPSREIPQSMWSGSDQLNVRIDSKRVPRTVEAERSRREQMYPGHTTRPYAEIPDLLQLYDAKGNPIWSFLTNRDDVRMPNGEPFFLDGLRTDDPEWNCRTFIGLPDGNELIVDFRVKHLADWHRIFPEVLRLIDSMKEQ